MPQKVTRLFALLIGIGDYPIDAHKLQAPIGDVAMIEEVLDLLEINKEIQISRKVLLDKKATRANIISAFSIFKDAQKGDQCFVYFSGHGSRIKAPFFDDQQEGLIESIVCYDSRIEEGLDLADKEFAFLLSENISKDAEAIIIIDSCHAGQNTRGNYLKSKDLDDRSAIRQIESFYGWGKYKKKLIDGHEIYSVAPIPHIHLAACAPHEKAQELSILGQVNSAFSFCLHEVLMNDKSGISYAALISKVRLRVNQFVQNQTPQIEAIGLPSEKKLTAFLGNTFKSRDESYFVFMDGNEGWKINAGQIDGVKKGDLVFIGDNKTGFNIGEVAINKSEVEDIVDLSPVKIHPSSVIRKEVPTVRVLIQIDEGEFPDWANELLEMKKSLWDIVLKEQDATHFLYMSQKDTSTSQQISLKQKGTDEDIWRLSPHEESNTTAFTVLMRLNQMAAFYQILNTSNPFSNIDNESIILNLKTQEFDKIGVAQENTEVSIYEPISLVQQQSGEKFYAPLILLDISNKSEIPLFASIQILGNGYDVSLKKSTLFSVTNRFMQQERLMPNETKGLIDFFQGTKYNTIPLQLMADFRNTKGNIAITYIKVWISTEPMDTNRMNQAGFRFGDDYYDLSRSSKKKLDKYLSDWQAFTIAIEVENVIS